MSDFQSMARRISHRRSLINRPCGARFNHNCDMESFADRVRSARKSAGLTQKQLATISGLSQTTISDIERGRNETSADVVALARTLGVLAEWLADGKGPRTLSEATGQSPAPTHTVRESVSHDLEQMSVEARAKIKALDTELDKDNPESIAYRVADLLDHINQPDAAAFHNELAQIGSELAQLQPESSKIGRASCRERVSSPV